MTKVFKLIVINKLSVLAKMNMMRADMVIEVWKGHRMLKDREENEEGT